jgi:hypothetical protein
MNFDIKEEDASHARQSQACCLWTMKQIDYSKPITIKTEFPQDTQVSLQQTL